MKQQLNAVRRYLTRIDAALFAAGVIGLILFFTLLPSQHPDSAATYRLDGEQAAEIAAAFLDQRGIAIPEDAYRTARLRRNEELLTALQREMGRPRTVRLLKTDTARARLPAYYWRVEWENERDEGEDYETEVLLTLGGEIYAFHADRPIMDEAPPPINRDALTYALAGWQVPEDVPSLSAVPDSLLARHLSFDISRAGVSQQKAAGQQRVVLSEANALAQRVGGNVFVVPTLEREAAVRLARYHLRRTAFDGYTFRVDSVWTEQQEANLQVTTVRLWGDAFNGQRPRVDVTVTATGALWALDAEFPGASTDAAYVAGEVTVYSPPEDRAAPSNQAAVEGEEGVNVEVSGNSAEDDTANLIAGITAGVLYVVLALAALFVFFRRMSARLVDTGSALRDGLWGGLFAAAIAVIPVLSSALHGGEDFWQIVLVVGLSFVFVGAGGAFLIFLASGAMDSVARAKWPAKLTTLDLVRHGVLRNVPLGATLLRGLAAAFVLLGGTTLLLAVLPGAIIHFHEVEFTLGNEILSTFGFFFAVSSFTGLFVGLTAMLGVGTLLYRWKPSGWVVVPGLAVLLTLLQVGLLPLRPLGLYALVTGFSALVLAWTFWRYDFVAFFTAYLVANVLFGTATGWMVEASPLAVDVGLAFLTAGGVLILGVVGLVSGHTATKVPDYAPSYIEELAEQERLKRDLEIAQDVQRSFLPRKMPDVEGLDLAAMCLPAQQVGGDYYDLIEVAPGKLVVVIGDVSGKGIEAAFFMTLVKGFVQTLACVEASPAEVLRRLNKLFCRNAPRGVFISMIYGLVDVETGVFTFARAGHNPLIARRSPQQAPAFVQPRGMALGLIDGASFDASIEEKTLHLEPGDTLVLYTDGFSEAMNVNGEQFGDDRLARTIGEADSTSASDVLRRITERVYRHIEATDRHDDMTMVVVRMGEAVGGATTASSERAVAL